MPQDRRIVMRRVYDAPGDAEGVRVLVDRLWPRGMTHAEVGEDIWAKDAAPSAELRTWFHSHPDQFDEFERRYRQELDDTGAAATLASQLKDAERITLLYAAKDSRLAHARVLAEALDEEL